MKKVFITFVGCLLALVGSTSLKAQEVASTLPKDANVLSFGVGYGSSTWPLSLSYDRNIFPAVIDKGSITLGGELDLTLSGLYKRVFLGPRAAFHYQFIDKLDTYVGLSLGVNYTRLSILGVSSSAFGLGHSAFIGARYHLLPQLGLMAEVGHGISWLKLGLGYSF